MKKFFKWTGIVLAVLLVAAGTGFYIWSQQTYGPTDELAERVEIPEQSADGDWITFGAGADTALILYPGAKVEREAYSYLGSELADAGYMVVIPDVPLNFALLGPGVAGDIMEAYPEVEVWYTGGHSLGGVAAASYAADHADVVEGVVFLASYTTEGNDLSDSGLRVLSVYGDSDGLIPLEEIESTRSLLPDDAVLYEVVGGNHAQFGVYGEQSGDAEASVSVWDQQDEVVEEVVRFFEAL